MKLVYAIVNNDDTYAVNKGLQKAGIRATKLSSTGGFLMAGNTTFMICCEDAQVDMVIEPPEQVTFAQDGVGDTHQRRTLCPEPRHCLYPYQRKVRAC